MTIALVLAAQGSVAAADYYGRVTFGAVPVPGATVTATGESWSPALAPGASAVFGFNATRGTANPRPNSFSLNGTPCAVS